MATPEPGSKNRCPQCGVEFICGVSAGEETCWCMALPIAEYERTGEISAASCYCPKCLKAFLSAAATSVAT